MLTKQCNFHCKHCMIDSEHDFSFMDKTVLHKSIEIIKNECPDSVYLIGGEVLLHIEEIEFIVNEIEKFCHEIVIFSNGTFLLDETLCKRIDALNVVIRISDDIYHRKQWTKKLQMLIESSGYLIVQKPEGEDMIPVGRAYEDWKWVKYNLGCSMLTGVYDERYVNHHRYMIMMNGDVNLYCATIEGSLANVYEDITITYDLLVKREKILHNYIMKNVITCMEDTYVAKLCNECQRYAITDKYILYDGKIIADAKKYI